MDEELAAAEERSSRQTAAIDAAYSRGELGDGGWHAANARLVVPACLCAETPEAVGLEPRWVGREYAGPSSPRRSNLDRRFSASGVRTAT